MPMKMKFGYYIKKVMYLNISRYKQRAISYALLLNFQ